MRAKRDWVALLPVPTAGYSVADRHLRKVGKDRLVAFDASRYPSRPRR